MKMKTVLGFSIGFLALLLGITSCGNGSPAALNEEQLFRLSLGFLEDDIDLFRREGLPQQDKNRLFFRNGLVYISNGNARKLMRFSSFGSLLSLIYNPTTNPEPVMLLEDTGNNESNRTAVAHDFRYLGDLAVDSRGYIYVEDRVPPEARSRNDEEGVLLDRVVLQFDPRGRYMGAWGQEGPGREPFSLIHGLHVNNQDEVVVISRSNRNWNVHWFSDSGVLLQEAQINEEELPLPDVQAAGRIYASLDNIMPDPQVRSVHVKVSYFQETLDGSTRNQSGIELLQSRILTYSADEEAFGLSFALPRLRLPNLFSAQGQAEMLDLPYEFIGMNSFGDFYLLSSAHGADLRLLVFNNRGQLTVERIIELNPARMDFSTFVVSPEGMLVALLSDGLGAEVLWWRVDRFLEHRS